MANTWILVAHRSGAKIFESTGAGAELRLARQIDHPEGRLQNHEIDTDRPGESDSRVGLGRHPKVPEQRATDHLAEEFAKKLAQIAERGRIDHAYGRLVLIAEPGFLGRLRGALPEATTQLVAATLDKNLMEESGAGIRRHLEDRILV
ncbi:MAG: host attachment protein [Myxococcales bacterium]|nr:host attachment protein [Myxococcales bacterium]